MSRRIAIRNARLMDPASGLDVKGGLLVENGKIADIGPRLFNDADPNDFEVIDARGLILAPGLVDACVHTGEPGAEHRETLASASESAAAGGVTTMAVMPTTNPVIDEPSLVDFLLRRAAATAKVRVAVVAALTKGRLGETMTDAERTVANARVLRRAMAYAANFDALVMAHAEEPDLTAGASATESEFSTRTGLPAAPAIAEAMIVARDIALVELTGARYHFAQISTRAALDLIVAAKARGLPITCGVAAHHLALNELDVGSYYTFRKVTPPLRSETDRAAMADGVARGAIDVIVSSHEPQGADTKRQPFAVAAAGSVGLETLLPVALSLYHNGADLMTVLRAVTASPANLLGLPAGTLAKGAPADLVLLDDGEPFVAEADKLHSRARNTAFEGRRFQGRAWMTFVGGEAVFKRA
jgi:dihydroorotase